jgi:hypothetical protein
MRPVEHHNVRLFSRSIEDDFATVGRDVEVADGKLATEIGQLALAAGFEIDEPELLGGRQMGSTAPTRRSTAAQRLASGGQPSGWRRPRRPAGA